jgi:DNA-binding MarR family transcriptional regulator
MNKAGFSFKVINMNTGAEFMVDQDISSLNDHDNDKKNKEFFMVYKGLNDLLLDRDLNGTDWRVFMCICDAMHDGGWCDMTQDVIASKAGTFRPNVNISIKKLISRGYIVRERNAISGRLTLRVLPEIAGAGGYATINARRALARKLKKKNGEIAPLKEPEE